MIITKTIVNSPIKEKMEEKHIKRVAAYARVSTDFDDQSESYDSQISYYEALIRNNKSYEYVGVYGDKGISGTSAENRPEFMKMIKDCLEGKIDFIFCKSISRFARNAAECSKYINIISEKGVVVYFEKENIRSDEKNLSVVLKILATLAQEESNSISQALKWSYLMNAKIGKPTRQAAYGYRKVKQGKNKHVWEIDQEQARKVRYAFSLALKGLSFKDIATELTKLEESEGTEYVWNHTRVGYMLTNEVYTGTILINKRVTIDYVTKKSINNKGEVEQVKIEGHHEPIISEYMFNAVRNELLCRRRGKYAHQQFKSSDGIISVR